MRREHDVALLVAMPLRHLEAARIVCEERGTSTLPAGGPGDLDSCEPGLIVLVIATDAQEAQVPAATWRARFERRVPHVAGTPWPEGLPLTWTVEHSPIGPTDATAHDEAQEAAHDEDEDDFDDEGRIGPQSFFSVRNLEPSPRADWLYANELVPKQQRRGRTFLPRTPRLIRLVD